jgi:hypothetical protein
MAKQLNVFVENRPGRVRSVSECLAEGKINIRAFTIQDRGNFGVIKLIVDKPRQAILILQEKGLACALRDILAVSIRDEPGNLHKLTAVLAENQVNISDMYGFVTDPNKTGVCCMEVESPEKIQPIVEKAGFKVLAEEELYEL